MKRGLSAVKEQVVPQLVLDGRDVAWWPGWSHQRVHYEWKKAIVFTIQQGVLYAAVADAQYSGPYAGVDPVRDRSFPPPSTTPADRAFTFNADNGGGGFTVKLRTKRAVAAYEVWVDRMREGGWVPEPALALGGFEYRDAPPHLVIDGADLVDFERETQEQGILGIREGALRRLTLIALGRGKLHASLETTEGNYGALSHGFPTLDMVQELPQFTFVFSSMDVRRGGGQKRGWWRIPETGERVFYQGRGDFWGDLTISKQAAQAYAVWVDKVRARGLGGLMERLVRR